MPTSPAPILWASGLLDLSDTAMNRRNFIKGIAIVGFGNLFLPRAMDRFRWKPARIVETETAQEIIPAFRFTDYILNPDYVSAPYEEIFLDLTKTKYCGSLEDAVWMAMPRRFNFPVDISNIEEVKRHCIPPFILDPKI